MPITNSKVLASLANDYPPSGTYHIALINDVSQTFTVTANPANDTLTTSVAHGLVPNTRVMFTTTGTLPAPLNDTSIYFVRNPFGTNLELSTTEGGSAIDITSAGTGTHSLLTIPLDFRDNSTAVWVRLELASYEGIGTTRPTWTPNTPTMVGDVATVSGLVPLDNTTGTNPVEFNKILVIQNGNNIIGDTSGEPIVYIEYNPAIIITGGSSFTADVRIRLRNG
jgi:hypothetical protein